MVRICFMPFPGGRWSTVAAGLAFCWLCLGGCASGQGGGQPGEGILMPFAVNGWVVGHSAENEAQRIQEWVRPGQTVDNWTELLTVQTFNKAVGLATVEDHIAAHRKDVAARCPGSTLEVIGQQPDGILYELRVVNCQKGGDEHGLHRVLEGKWNRFVVQYAIRGASMAPALRAEWIESLQTAQIRNLP